MAYLSRVTGEFRIEPRLDWSEIRGSRFYHDDGRRGMPDVLLDVRQEKEEDDDGFRVRLYADHARPCRDEMYRAGSVFEDVEELYTAFPGHTVRGEVLVQGEDYGDVFRVVADDAGVRKEVARWIWPDGSDVEPP